MTTKRYNRAKEKELMKTIGVGSNEEEEKQIEEPVELLPTTPTKIKLGDIFPNIALEFSANGGNNKIAT